MKRLWVILSLFLLTFVWAVTCVAQKITSPEPEHEEFFDKIKKRLELREEMHRRMREKILRGQGSDTDLFEGMDQMFEDAFKDLNSFGSSFSSQYSNFKSEWIEDSSGRTLILTPKSKDQQLNIDVNATTITIKGKIEQRSESGTLMSSFNNSFSVPADCDGTKVKMSHKDGKILVHLPYKSLKSVPGPKSGKPVGPIEDERKPLSPSKDDVTI
jgi:HSP20 family molecular chaperone IbpA